MKISRSGLATLIAAIVAMATLVPVQGAEAVTYKAASAVRSVKSADAWTKDAPRTPKIKLSWTKPAYTYGATTIGYAIQVSTDKITWKTIVSNTKSTLTSATVSSGLAIGVTNYFRVRAITKRDSKTLWGTYSSVIGRKPTAKPTNPVLLGDSSVKGLEGNSFEVVWLQQNPSQRGGLHVTYTASAFRNGIEEQACQVVRKYVTPAEDLETPTSWCTLESLVPGGDYEFWVSVENYRGMGKNTETFLPADSLFGLQWYLGVSNGISATRAWTATKGSSNVVVAVLDSGITKHSDLTGQLVAGYDFVGNRVSAPVGDSNWAPSGDGDGWDSDPTDTGNPYDDPTTTSDDATWHGTHVAGIIAAKQDSVGVVGVAPKVKIQPVRVIGPKSGNVCDLAYGIRWAAGVPFEPLPNCETFPGVPANPTPARVINISLEAPIACPNILQEAVDAAQARGAIIVTAAGNGDTSGNPVSNSSVSPTSCRGPISVGATGFLKDRTSYTNYDVDISAPGGDFESPSGAPSLGDYGKRGDRSFSGLILSTWNTGTKGPSSGSYRGEAGTSMAAPVVAGIVALMVSARPKATYSQITNALMDSARPFDAGTECSVVNNCGTGVADAAEALKALILAVEKNQI
jgi:serine protease